MMKRTLTAFLLVLTLGIQPARAFLMDAPAEQVELVAHFGQLIASTTLYLETVREATEYIGSVGTLWENAAMKALSSVSSEMSSFQDKLNFSNASSFASLLGKNASDFLDDNGMKDWREGVEDSVDQLKQEAGDAVQTIQNGANAAKDKVAGAVDQVKETVGETAGKIKDGIEESYEDSIGKKDNDSSSSRVVVVKSNFGHPQSNKKAAEKFIRSRYYYSTKDGDTYMGNPLTDTDEANRLVQKNRIGYHQEIVTMALATAYEASSTVKDESVERMRVLKKKASTVKTLDDRKAVEALIVQEEVRQRMLRLNLEIALLEKEIVDQMLSVEPNYIIARTPEQITEDTKRKEVEE